jgi:hypothetical protein
MDITKTGGAALGWNIDVDAEKQENTYFLDTV